MAMKVKIKYGGMIAELIKKSEEIYECNEQNLDVMQLIKRLFNKYLELAKFYENNPLKIFEESMVFVNERVINPNEINIVNVNEGDLVMFLPIVTGG
ncbi:MAG: MoaD/ThiS family protein [Nitrososphaeria archaeon]